MNKEGSVYRVLVVEDEVGVRRSLIGKLRRTSLPLEVTDEAENAEEALVVIEAEKPDIILLDMRMPGMGGYHFLKIVSNQYPSIKLIVLSGYSDFEYVQQSLRCGAVDYLLKPLIFEELEDTLRKAIRKIQEEKQGLKNGILLNQAIPLLKYQLLERILSPSYSDVIKEKLKHLNVNIDFPCYGLLIVKVCNFDQLKQYYMQDASTVFFVFENIVHDSVDRPERLICFPWKLAEDEFVCLIGLDPEHLPEDELYNWRGALQRLRENLRKFANFRVRMGVSRPFRYLKEALMAYDQMKDRMRDLLAEGIFFFEDDEQWTGRIPEEFGRSLVSALERKDIHALSGMMRSLLFQPQTVLDPAGSMNWRQTSFVAYYALKQAAHQLFAVPDKAESILARWNDAGARELDLEQVYDLFMKMAIEIGELAANRNRSNSKEIIDQAQSYLRTNYFEDITLEALARKFYLNRTYFSELFKKETGWTFKRYLCHIRIEKAKQLLIQQKLRPSAVAELVGIKDPVYFSVLFKKMTGVPPGEFQQKHRTG